MKWSDLPFKPTARVLRQFAAAWLVFFLVVGAYRYVARGQHLVGIVVGVMAVVVGVTGLIRPTAVRWLFVGATGLAFPIGWVVSQIMLGLMFYGIITPLALLFRLQGRDLLARKPAPNRPTFWTPKQTPEDMGTYFRQY
jgi:Saxitoxin biosynthesis operon protein SxtJ